MRILLIILCILIASPVMCGMEFDGVNQYVDLGSGALIDGLDNFSISAWINTSTTLGEQSIFQDYYAYAAPFGLSFYISGQNLKARFRSAVGGNLYVISGIVTSGTWRHVTLTFSKPLIKLYIDTVEDGTGSFNDVMTTTSSSSWIGARKVTTPDTLFDGNISDVRVYSRTLSLAEIQSIYHSRGADNIVNGLNGRWLMNEGTDGAVASGANTCIDISGNSNDGTPTNSPIYRATPIKLIRRPR